MSYVQLSVVGKKKKKSYERLSLNKHCHLNAAAIDGKLPQIAGKKGCNLPLGSNSRLHVAMVTRQKWSQFGWEVATYPTYLTNIACSDYHLFQS